MKALTAAGAEVVDVGDSFKKYGFFTELEVKQGNLMVNRVQ